MNVDEAILLEYVDGMLPADVRVQVEAAIDNVPEFKAKVEALRVSRLPYQAAFDRQALPALPTSLERRVADLIRVSSPTQVQSSRQGDAARRRWMQFGIAASIAVAFATGVFSVQLADSIGARGRPAAWVEAVSNYQDLYVRDTLASIVPDAAVTRKLMAEVRERDGLPIAVPDLRSAGLEFKRVQRLAFRGRTLIQIAYLPQHGEPIALCIMDQLTGNADMRTAVVGDMNTANWEQNGVAYLLVGKDSAAHITALAQQIRNGKMPLLYG